MNLKNLSWRELNDSEYSYLVKDNRPFYLVLDIVFFILIVSFIACIIATIVNFNPVKDILAIVAFTGLIVGLFFLRKRVRKLGMADIENRNFMGVEALFVKCENASNVYKGRTYYEWYTTITIDKKEIKVKSKIVNVSEGEKVLLIRPRDSFDIKFMSVIPYIKE